MAVPALISKLSIFLRYETQLAEKGFARWTRMDDHDDRLSKLKGNITQIVTTKKPDSVKYYQRIFGQHGTIGLKFIKNLDVEKQEIPAKTLAYIANTTNEIREMIQKRHGDSTELEQFIRNSKKVENLSKK